MLAAVVEMSTVVYVYSTNLIQYIYITVHRTLCIFVHPKYSKGCSNCTMSSKQYEVMYQVLYSTIYYLEYMVLNKSLAVFLHLNK